MANLTAVTTAFAGAASATLATAITNYNTAAATAITNAQGAANFNPNSLKVAPMGMVWDGTNYTPSGSVTYTTGG